MEQEPTSFFLGQSVAQRSDSRWALRTNYFKEPLKPYSSLLSPLFPLDMNRKFWSSSSISA